MIEDRNIVILAQEALNTRGAAAGLPAIDVDGWWGAETQALFAHVGPAQPRISVDGTSWGDVLAQFAEGEVGVRENGGNNRGERVELYQRSTWLPVGAWPWCAAFVCWCCQRLKEAAMGQLLWTRPQTAGAWDFERWAQDEKPHGVRLYRPEAVTQIRRGDILVYRFSHIGIAVGAEKNGMIATVEGNTNGDGSREGDGVYRKLRARSVVRSVIRVA